MSASRRVNLRRRYTMSQRTPTRYKGEVASHPGRGNHPHRIGNWSPRPSVPPTADNGQVGRVSQSTDKSLGTAYIRACADGA